MPSPAENNLILACCIHPIVAYNQRHKSSFPDLGVGPSLKGGVQLEWGMHGTNVKQGLLAEGIIVLISSSYSREIL